MLPQLSSAINQAVMTFPELCSSISVNQLIYDFYLDRFWANWFRESGFRFTVVKRLCAFFHSQCWSRRGIYHLFRCWRHRQLAKYVVYISSASRIGPGLYLGQLLNIVVDTRAVIGNDRTLGETHPRSQNYGFPTLQDCVYLGCGATVAGGITLGDGAAVGPNSVAVKEAPSKAVVSRIPAIIISMKGSSGYVAYPTTPVPPATV